MRNPRLRALATVVLVACFVVFFATGAAALFSRHSFALDLTLELSGGIAIILGGMLYPRSAADGEKHPGNG